MHFLRDSGKKKFEHWGVVVKWGGVRLAPSCFRLWTSICKQSERSPRARSPAISPRLSPVHVRARSCFLWTAWEAAELRHNWWERDCSAALVGPPTPPLIPWNSSLQSPAFVREEKFAFLLVFSSIYTNVVYLIMIVIMISDTVHRKIWFLTHPFLTFCI